MRRLSLWLITIVLLAISSMSLTQAQDPQQAVTIALPPFTEAIIDEAIVDDFEAQTGVTVEFIYDSNPPSANSAPRTADDVEGYAEDLDLYFSSADVVFVDNFLKPEITRADYVLDLTPLISADSSMNPQDFYAGIWESFMWDGGMWAIPIAAEPLFIDFIPQAFDDAGLTYPNQNWTLDDLAFAASELTQYDETGAVTLPGMLISAAERDALFRALLGQGFYDDFAIPSEPRINNSELTSLLETWQDLIDDGVIRVGGGGGFGGQNNEIPIQIGSGGDITVFIVDEDGNETDAGGTPDTSIERTIAPLPNGQAILLSNGLAISSGSTIPDIAYQLVRYLSEQQAFADIAIGSEPARRQYFTESLETTGLSINFGENRTEAEIALITDALENGLPSSELRFSQYVSAAFSELQNGTSATDALQEAEIEAFETLQAIDDLETAITVTSGLAPSLAAGEIIIEFGFQSFVQPLPNEADWDEAIADFVANDPDIGAIDLDIINIATRLITGNSTDTYDCTYYPNTIFADIDSEVLLALDPLMFSDPNYDVGDLPFGTLPLTQLNGVTYGLPITIQPQMLQYDADVFAQAGLPEPIGGWSISEFGDALIALDRVLDEETAPFTAGGFDNTYLLMLTAAQGAIPIDTSTVPPTLDFTSEASVTAIESILEWVDEGYIDQGNLDGAGAGGAAGLFGGSDSPIAPTFFGGFSNPELNFTTYPSGSAYTPLAFDVGAGYISIDTDVPEACFRWLSYISRQPELFTGAMPAQVSLLDRPEVQDSLSADAIEAYRIIAEQMNAFNVVNFNATDPFLTTWLIRAFETYLADDLELLPELEDAQLYTSDYIACTENLEFELSLQLLQELQACVEAVDSALLE